MIDGSHKEPGLDPIAATPTGAFHPSRPCFRFTVLLFAGLITYGSYFAYDCIGALSTQLIAAWDTDREAIAFFQTIYSLAAIPTVVFGGILIDRLGTRRASLLFSVFVLLGAAILAGAQEIGSNLGLVPIHVAYAGRFIFGAGSECLIVAQCAICARWFRGKELALSFGLTLMISRLGSLFSFNTESRIAERFGLEAALWAPVVLCGLSLAANVVYAILDRRGSRILRLEDSAGDRIVLRDVVRFRPSYWCLVLICVAFYSAIFPFQTLAADFFHEKWGLPSTSPASGSFFEEVFQDFLHMGATAPGTTSIIIFASLAFAPFAGILIDLLGRRTSIMILGALLLIPAHLAMALTHTPPWISMIVLGTAFVIVPAVLWPAVPLIVEKERVGTAFGLMTTIQNGGLALFNVLNGTLRDSTHDYTASLLMFAGLGVVGLFGALGLAYFDRRAGSVLERRTLLSAGN